MIPGSALRKLSAQTGLEAVKSSDGCYRLNISPGVAFFAFVKDEQDACRSLRQDNWRRVCNNVFESQKWLCNKCQMFRPLQGHHIRFKSRWRRQDGPLDIESNVVGLCQSCHGDEHGV